ncbi:hypothetical protein A3843_01260 [Pseudovibrio exalbescens]|uniref:Uncharacterized protein n=1 Tax=Pseudovibrio exalbescens TaxID=197461 RepID=A0A1U7JM26_9HYPH|nr:hypothetical protein A3843_01260 [Pseudovibrio exalbescens]
MNGTAQHDPGSHMPRGHHEFDNIAAPSVILLVDQRGGAEQKNTRFRQFPAVPGSSAKALVALAIPIGYFALIMGLCSMRIREQLRLSML